MTMDGADPLKIARAKTFWMEVDVDQVFDKLCEYLIQLRSSIKTCTATDREYVQGMNMVTALDAGLDKTAPAATNDSFVEVVIGAGKLYSDGHYFSNSLFYTHRYSFSFKRVTF